MGGTCSNFILVAVLLLANLLRCVFPFLRKSLIPSALIGGTIVLLLKPIPAVNNFINNDFMALSCIGVYRDGTQKDGRKQADDHEGGARIRLVAGGVYSMQAMLGIGIGILLCVLGGFSFAAGGVLLALGFGQGTASNGMILLREIDPKLETPAASNMVYSGLPAIAFGGGLLLLLGYCPKGLVESIITFAILFVAFVVFMLILFRTKIFKRRKGKSIPPSNGDPSSPADDSAEGSDTADTASPVVESTEGTDPSEPQ